MRACKEVRTLRVIAERQGPPFLPLFTATHFNANCPSYDLVINKSASVASKQKISVKGKPTDTHLSGASPHFPQPTVSNICARALLIYSHCGRHLRVQHQVAGLPQENTGKYLGLVSALSCCRNKTTTTLHFLTVSLLRRFSPPPCCISCAIVRLSPHPFISLCFLHQSPSLPVVAFVPFYVPTVSLPSTSICCNIV